MNAYFARPDPDKLTAFHLYGWRGGLKTGMYYLRSLPSTDPIQFVSWTSGCWPRSPKRRTRQANVGCSS